MKVYFGTSPRTKEKYPEVEDIYGLISKLGYKQTSDWVKVVKAEDFYQSSVKEMDDHHKRMTRAIKAADICVFEVSSHSLSVGYLVNFALELGKTVVVLSQSQEPLILFKTIKSDKLITVVYSKTNLKDRLEKALSEASGCSDVRFNFFVNAKILAYLDWVAKTKKVPRSVFLRGLIEKQMRKDKEFRG